MFQMERRHYNMRCKTKDFLSLKIFMVNVIQIIKLHTNPKLACVMLGCTISISDITITYFTGESYITI